MQITATYTGISRGTVRTHMNRDGRRECDRELMPGDRVIVSHEGDNENNRATYVKPCGAHGHGYGQNWFLTSPTHLSQVSTQP